MKLRPVQAPDVKYARSGGVAIAFQAIGEGPLDLVFVPFFGNIRWAWEQPLFAHFLERLASFSRLILFDKRGTGLSDRPRVLTLETQMDDIRAVLDAVGSERAALLGAVQGSQLCALFAATYPGRTRGLVLFNPHASPADVPLAPRSGDEARERWGSRELSEEFARAAYPSLAGDPAFLRWHADYLRFAASPGAAAEFFRMLHDTDVSDVLPTIRVPTLVIYRAWRRDAALRVSELIPDARAVQIPGDGGAWVGDEVPVEVERFLSGQEEAPVPESILTTVLFTDIVGSTERAAELGDRAWRDLLARHHAAVRRELARFRGRNSTRPATASSQPSTGRPGRSAARRPSSPPSPTSASTCVPACTPASARSTTASSQASRSASARAWPGRPERAKSSSRARYAISWRGPALSSTISERARSRASPGSGGCSRCAPWSGHRAARRDVKGDSRTGAAKA